MFFGRDIARDVLKRKAVCKDLVLSRSTILSMFYVHFSIKLKATDVYKDGDSGIDIHHGVNGDRGGLQFSHKEKDKQRMDINRQNSSERQHKQGTVV